MIGGTPAPDAAPAVPKPRWLAAMHGFENWLLVLVLALMSHFQSAT